MPSHLFAPPKLFLATSADEVAVTEHASEAVLMSPTSILQAGNSHISPAACHERSSGGAVNPFSRGGSSGGDRRSQCQRRRPWEARPVGLGLAGALNGEATGAATTTVLAGRRLLPTHTTSAPCSPSPVVAASEEFGVKSCRSPAFADRRVSPRKMEASEGYTRVIARGSNARTTHIFDDRGMSAGGGEDEFLRWCHGCSKELGHGKDIFMYRGEMAFCSHECRYRKFSDAGEGHLVILHPCSRVAILFPCSLNSKLCVLNLEHEAQAIVQPWAEFSIRRNRSGPVEGPLQGRHSANRRRRGSLHLRLCPGRSLPKLLSAAAAAAAIPLFSGASSSLLLLLLTTPGASGILTQSLSRAAAPLVRRRFARLRPAKRRPVRRHPRSTSPRAFQPALLWRRRRRRRRRPQARPYNAGRGPRPKAPKSCQMLRVGRIFERSSSSIAVSSFLVGPRHSFDLESPQCLNHRCHGTNQTGDNNIKFLRPKLNVGIYGAFLSTITETVLVQAHDPSQLALEIENAIDQQRFDDAWRAYEKHIHMDGLPRKSVLSKLITGLAESYDDRWLNQSYNVVSYAFEEKYELLDKEPLIYLSLTLARCALPNLAINVVRKLIKMEAYPPVAAWSAIVAHMCQNNTGAFLAADLVMEIGYLFQNNRVDPRKKSNRPLLSMKPNSFTFNIVLIASLLFGITKKAEQLLELMPRIGVKPEGNLLIIMARIYEKNGRKDEIQKLKRHVDEACGLSESEFRQFYDCLLSCRLKFGDLDSAADMVLDMLRKGKNAKQSLEAAKAVLEAVENRKIYLPSEKMGTENSCSSDRSVSISQMLKYAPFLKDKSFARIEFEARQLLKLISDKLQEQVGLVKSEHGILHPTETVYAKIVKAFLEADKIGALASFLVKASKEDSPVSIESSFVVQVINACISLGLLEQAHDLLDEMRFSGIRVGSAVYSSLLKAYCKEGQHEDDITALLKDARKEGIQIDASCYEDLIQSRVHHSDTTGALHLFKELKDLNVLKSGHKEFQMLVQGRYNNEADLTARLVEEVRSGNMVDHAVHDWNNVIHFFCKKRLMHDAHRALNKMRALGHVPNAQTFHSLVTAYAAIGGKYVEVTDLWGEMKVMANSRSMKFDQELLDSLLYCFVRGGFFLRAMEVIEMMERNEMFIDKYKYKSLWLKYHRTMYKGKAPKVQTEAQLKRREAALHFKKWIGLT
ncbi:hypothetical protein EJB05_22781, partial [Eragrostis curvula]